MKKKQARAELKQELQLINREAFQMSNMKMDPQSQKALNNLKEEIRILNSEVLKVHSNIQKIPQALFEKLTTREDLNEEGLAVEAIEAVAALDEAMDILEDTVGGLEHSHPLKELILKQLKDATQQTANLIRVLDATNHI